MIVSLLVMFFDPLVSRRLDVSGGGQWVGCKQRGRHWLHSIDCCVTEPMFHLFYDDVSIWFIDLPYDLYIFATCHYFQHLLSYPATKYFRDVHSVPERRYQTQILTDFQISFTGWFLNKFTVNWLLRICLQCFDAVGWAAGKASGP